MEADALLAGAAEATGLDDFGDPAFREGLDVLIASVEAEAALNELGRLALPGLINGWLSNRLRVVDWTKAHPEVADERIERPWFVIGMPRTGTTLLNNLMDEDPGNRTLYGWESGDSVPPPVPDERKTGPRALAALASPGTGDLNPGFKAIHDEPPDGPGEDVTVLAQDFKSIMFEVLAHIPSYSKWLFSCDSSSAYRYHKMVLQLLQSGTPGHWSLKTPHHCLTLDYLFAEYPDACVIVTHRDPAKVAGSLISLVRSLSGSFTDADHNDYITDHWIDVMDTCVHRVMDYRDRHGDGQFHDMSYAELLRDPVGAVAKAYAAFGAELDDATAAAMAAHVEANPKGKHGTHRYDLADFGVARGEIDERFARYVERYAVERED